jgi:hypothetical protein
MNFIIRIFIYFFTQTNHIGCINCIKLRTTRFAILILFIECSYAINIYAICIQTLIFIIKIKLKEMQNKKFTAFDLISVQTLLSEHLLHSSGHFTIIIFSYLNPKLFRVGLLNSVSSNK